MRMKSDSWARLKDGVGADEKLRMKAVRRRRIREHGFARGDSRRFHNNLKNT